MSATQRHGDTDDDSDQYEHQRLAQDLPKNIIGLGSQRQANTDVSRAAGYRVGHQAVEANGSEKQSQQAESAGELLDEAVGLQRVVDQPGHRMHLDGWKRRSRLLDNAAKRGSYGLRIGIGAHFIEGGRIFPHGIGERSVDARQSFLSQ